MKKFIALVATAVLVCICGTAAFADTSHSNGEDAETNIKFTVSPESYEWTITPDVTFSITALSKSIDSSITEGRVFVNHKAQIVLKSSENAESMNIFFMKDSSKVSSIPYSLKNGSQPCGINAVIAQVDGAGTYATVSTSGSVTASTTKESISEASIPGVHTDVLTFEASIVNR